MHADWFWLIFHVFSQNCGHTEWINPVSLANFSPAVVESREMRSSQAIKVLIGTFTWTLSKLDLSSPTRHDDDRAEFYARICVRARERGRERGRRIQFCDISTSIYHWILFIRKMTEQWNDVWAYSICRGSDRDCLSAGCKFLSCGLLFIPFTVVDSESSPE